MSAAQPRMRLPSAIRLGPQPLARDVSVRTTAAPALMSAQLRRSRTSVFVVPLTSTFSVIDSA